MIEENSPIGWLIFFGTMAFLAWFAFGISRNTMINPHPRKSYFLYDPKQEWRMNQSICAKCGSENIKFDYGRVINFDTTGICKDCGYTWVWQDRKA